MYILNIAPFLFTNLNQNCIIVQNEHYIGYVRYNNTTSTLYCQ